MRHVTAITVKDSMPPGTSPYRSLYCAAVDEANGYAYFTTAGAIDPGKIIKVKISGGPLQLTEVGEADDNDTTGLLRPLTCVCGTLCVQVCAYAEGYSFCLSHIARVWLMMRNLTMNAMTSF